MSIEEKIANAKTTDWLTRDVSNFKLKWICCMSYIIALIETAVKKLSE